MAETTKHKIFGFINGSWGPEDLVVVALGDDGEHLADHISSNESWAKHDIANMGKPATYDAHFGEGNWELVWVDKPDENPECLAAIEKNKAMAK